MARRLDAANLDALAPALDNAQLNHPEVAELRGKLSALPKPGAGLRDAGGPALAFVRARDGGAAFALATREATRGEFAAFVRDSGHTVGKCRDSGGPLAMLRRRSWQEPGFTQRDDEPVVCVTHEDATAYAQWLTRKTGQRYRLPNAGEWLAAARGMGASTEPCRVGNVLDASVSERALTRERYACNDGAPHTAAVGRYVANALGVFDLIGNVGEWLDGCAAASGAGGCAARPWAGSSWRAGEDVALAAVNEPRAGEPGAPWIGFRVLRELTLDTLPATTR
jgi:formylglycine-generating enzyme required for sulfatase activity